jgi:hypothetical protein
MIFLVLDTHRVQVDHIIKPMDNTIKWNVNMNMVLVRAERVEEVITRIEVTMHMTSKSLKEL